MDLVKLHSVGSVVDFDTKVVYPQMEDGTPDLDMGVHMDEVTEEWLESLSSTDYLLVYSSK